MLCTFSLPIAAFIAVIGLTSAQNSTGTTSVYSYTVPAGSVSPTQAAYYCTSQRNTCRQVCGGSAPTDQCDSTTFQYTCTCGDGSTPDLTKYNNSLPFFQCQEYQNQCVMNTNDATKQLECRAIECGGMNPVAAESSIQSSMSAAMNTASSTSSDESASETGSSSDSSTSTAAPNGAGSARDLTGMSGTYGLMAFIATGLMLFGGVLAL